MRTQVCANRTEWLTARLDGVGCSELAAICGKSRYRSPWEVWQEKVDRVVVEGLSYPSKEAEAGHRLEGAVADWFADVAGVPLIPFDPGDFTIAWSDGRLFGTVDRLLLDELAQPQAVLELKTARYERVRVFGHELPREYRFQVQGQMYCTGVSEAYYAVLLNGVELRWYREQRHERFLASILRKVDEFWQLVQSKIPPATDWHPGTAGAIAAHYPEVTEEPMYLAPEFGPLDAERLLLGAKLNELTRRKTAIDNQLRAALGGAVYGVLPNGKGAYTWRRDSRGMRTLRRTKHYEEEQTDE